MVSLDEDPMRMVRRNKLLGMWAAEKLGLVGESADAYSTDLAMGTLDLNAATCLAKSARTSTMLAWPNPMRNFAAS